MNKARLQRESLTSIGADLSERASLERKARHVLMNNCLKFIGFWKFHGLVAFGYGNGCLRGASVAPAQDTVFRERPVDQVPIVRSGRPPGSVL